MTTLDYTSLFEPPTVLTLTPIPGGYMVSDQHGRPWTLAPVDLTFALTFMRAAAVKNHALIDDASVERATWQPSSAGVPAGIAAFPPTPPVPHGEAATPADEYSRRVPMADVIPIGKRSA